MSKAEWLAWQKEVIREEAKQLLGQQKMNLAIANLSQLMFLARFTKI